MPAVGSPDSSWAQLGTFCSFPYCFQGQIHSDICRWEITWTWSLLQQQWVPDRALQGGGTAPVWNCSSPTGCLWNKYCTGAGCPSACRGQTLPRTALTADLEGSSRRPWGCNILSQHTPGHVPGAMGIKQALAPWEYSGYSSNELRHQAQSWAAGLPLSLFHSSCQVYISLRKENI